MPDTIVETTKDINPNFQLEKQPDFNNIDRKDLIILSKSLDGTSPATAANYGVILNVKTALQVVYAVVSWQVASTSGTLNLERLSGTEALDAGDAMFVAVVDMSTTANTLNVKTGKALQNTTLKQGDRLAIKDAGNLANQVGMCITIYLKPLQKGDYA